MTFGLACCAIENDRVPHPGTTWTVMGQESSEPPRQSDLMIVAGTVCRRMAPVIRKIYDQMPEPKLRHCDGVPATSGNIYDSYSVVQGVDHFVPVDIYVPGCPPYSGSPLRRHSETAGAHHAKARVPFTAEGSQGRPEGLTDGNLVHESPSKRIEETFPGACTKVAEWRGDVAVTVNRASLHDVAQFLRDDPALRFDYIVHVSSVDWPDDEERFEVVYEVYSVRTRQRIRLKARGAGIRLYRGLSDRHLERRRFHGARGLRHDGDPIPEPSDLRRILMPDEYDEGYPQVKTFRSRKGLA